MTDIIRSFKLANSFLEKYKGTQPNWGPVGYITYKRTYARALEDGTLEEFYNTCQRVVEGCYDIQKEHCRTLKLPWDNAKAQKSAQEMFARMWDFKWLPPGRGLWMMGAKHVDRVGSAALNNCFSGDTKIFVDNLKNPGNPILIKMSDYISEDIKVFLSQGGGFFPAQIKCFGKQEVQRVTFKPKGLKSNYSFSYEVTPDHRWILSNGEETTNLSIGDKVCIKPCHIKQDGFYTEGFAHGLIFGDGTKHTYHPERQFIRLCGKDKKFVDLLRTVKGFKSVTYPQSYNGDPVVTIIRKDVSFKELPDVSRVTRSYLSGFLQGWMAADAHKQSSSWQLDTTNVKAAEWLSQWAPLLGFCITGWSTEESDTNFGPRKHPLQRISLVSKPVVYVVREISPLGIKDVFCPVVPNENKFTLSNGLVTGNCGFVSTIGIKEDLADPFVWMMDMLMLGVGVGFDTKGAGLVKIQEPKYSEEIHIVEDSREGWVGVLKATITPFSGKGAIPLNVDYSRVRPAGVPIKGFGGTASGPGPLSELVIDVRKILSSRIGETLTSTDIVDICNLIGRCVVAGNVRRSAEISFGDPTDLAFMELKNPEKAGEALMHHRWASNNSIFATVGMDYTEAAKLTAINGEPGYEWLENAKAYSRMGRDPDFRDRRAAGGNPCLEQTLEDRELCCLVETFPSLHDTYEDYEKTLKYAYLYAKSVTLIPTHDERTNTVMQRNRRIGTSMSGIVQAMHKHGTRNFFKWCDNGYKYLKELDQTYSDWLCIRKSIKLTSVKPSGTVSLLPGVTPGIHYPHSSHYIRRIRFQSDSPLVSILVSHGYHVVADNYSPNTVCVDFPIKEDYFERAKDEVSMWEQLELAAQMQQYWVDNQVSVTITFKPEESSSIKRALELYETRLKGVSFLPLENHGYTQAPFESITEDEYNQLVSTITPITNLYAVVHEQTERFCDGDICVVK